MSKHLCALDCKFVSKCKWVLSKKKDPTKFKGLVAKPIVFRDGDKEIHGFKITECPNYQLDERSVINKLAVAVPQGEQKYTAATRWTAEEKAKVAEMYSEYTYAEIGKRLNRAEGGVGRIVAQLRREGIIK